MLKPILEAAYYLERGFDKLRWSYLKEFNRIGPLMIISFRGFGNREKAYVRGRLIEDRNLRPAREADSKWRNLRSMYKRFESYEIPNARIQADFYGQQFETVTDHEGYFEFSLPTPADINQTILWHDVQFRLLDKIGKNGGTLTALGQINIPRQEAEYGVISDIDDTVLQTSATNYIRMMQQTFLHNARTRLPFEGVAAFYRALNMGSNDTSIRNPLYYVSSSPWNLYDMLKEFFEIHQIPPGPFMLRSIRFEPAKLFQSGHKDHKLSQIEKIFNYTGELPFILIGDSGQKDPEIYLEVVRKYPGRILAVYIRDVSKAKRDKTVYAIIDEMQSLGTEMLFVKDTEAAARHAISQGYIRPLELKVVQEEKAKDRSL